MTTENLKAVLTEDEKELFDLLDHSVDELGIVMVAHVNGFLANYKDVISRLADEVVRLQAGDYMEGFEEGVASCQGRIQELEAENGMLQRDVVRFNNEVSELGGDFFPPIATEGPTLKYKIAGLEGDVELRDNRIRELEKENTRLKKKVASMQEAVNRADPLDPSYVRYLELEEKIRELEADSEQLRKRLLRVTQEREAFRDHSMCLEEKLKAWEESDVLEIRAGTYHLKPKGGAWIEK